MPDRSRLSLPNQLLAALGGLCAIPAFVFLSSTGVRVSLTAVSWKECWLGLPSWQGIPVPLVLPIALVLLLAGWIRASRAATPFQKDTGFLLGLGLLLALGLSVSAGPARAIQLLLPLVVLASVPLAFQGSARLALARGWCLGAGLFLTLQLAGLWWRLGTPLPLAHAARVNGAQGEWAVGDICRFWGLCIYQAFITMPDLALGFATVCGVCWLMPEAPGRWRRWPAALWGSGWLIGMISAWTSGRSSVLLVLLLQLALGVVLFIQTRSPLWTIPALSLTSLALLSVGSQRPVLVDRLLSKHASHQLFDRQELWQHATQQIAQNPQHLLAGNHADLAGTHSLLGDILLRVGLPLTLLYLAVLALLAVRAWQRVRHAVSPSAQAGLVLLLAIPVVQNLVNANLLQPFGFLNLVMAAVAMASLV